MSTSNPVPVEQPSAATETEWCHEELRNFWEKAWGPHMRPPLDGMHPKGLCAKVANDFLGLNPNLSRRVHQDNTNLTLDAIEQAFKELEVIRPMTTLTEEGKPVVHRVLQRDFNSAKLAAKATEKGGLKSWVKSIVSPTLSMA